MDTALFEFTRELDPEYERVNGDFESLTSGRQCERVLKTFERCHGLFIALPGKHRQRRHRTTNKSFPCWRYLFRLDSSYLILLNSCSTRSDIKTTVNETFA
jgi:hypothetical protein